MISSLKKKFFKKNKSLNSINEDDDNFPTSIIEGSDFSNPLNNDNNSPISVFEADKSPTSILDPNDSIDYLGHEKKAVSSGIENVITSSDSGFDVESSNVLSKIKSNSSLDIKNNVSDPNAPEKLTKDVITDPYAGISNLENSPYPEVRACVPPTDDVSIPVNTLRMWFIGFLITTIGSGCNVLFSLHAPSFSLNSYLACILAWPFAVAWDFIMPNKSLFGMPLKQGKFNLKEHVVITIMANVTFAGGAAYGTEIFLAMSQYYNMRWGFGWQIITMLATQCIGFSIAGIIRSLLVYPASMIWPATLVQCTLVTNIHSNENHPVSGWKISRLNFLAVVMIASFVWYWFPNYIAPFLSYFAWETWIAPNNPVVNQLFGASTGIGLIPITFDWNQISNYMYSPLIYPSFAHFNIIVSVFVFFWIVTPALHFSNYWYGKYLPISDSGTYDRFQNPYEVANILNKDHSFNEAAYKKYSPLYLSTTFALSYGISFASITSTIVHCICFHSKEIYNHIKQSKTEDEDIHRKLMRNYKETPLWCYFVCFLIFFGLAIASVRAWDTGMPVWALIIALLISFVMTVPIAIIAAVSNLAIGLNVITEFIVGYMIPGKPIAMMLFKTYGYITMNQAVTYLQDMKFGHYMKIPPRLVFWAQVLMSIWSCFVQTAVYLWAINYFPDVCTARQVSNFTCPSAKVFFNSSVIWGVIGPQRMFSKGELFYGLLFFFIVGAACPFIQWLYLKWRPSSWFKYVHFPVFFNGTGNIPPATPYNYVTWGTVGIIFNYFIRKNHFGWWSKYNYSLSCGLDLGMQIAGLILFLALSLTSTEFPSWWGTDVVNNTMDTKGIAIQVVLKDGEYFGPSEW